MAQPANKLVWDHSLPDSLALAKSLENAGDIAAQLSRRHITPDGHGARHRLYSAADFLAKYGQAAVIIADPGDHQANDKAVQIANTKRRQTAFDVQQRTDGILEFEVSREPLAPTHQSND